MALNNVLAGQKARPVWRIFSGFGGIDMMLPSVIETSILTAAPQPYYFSNVMRTTSDSSVPRVMATVRRSGDTLKSKMSLSVKCVTGTAGPLPVTGCATMLRRNNDWPPGTRIT